MERVLLSNPPNSVRKVATWECSIADPPPPLILDAALFGQIKKKKGKSEETSSTSKGKLSGEAGSDGGFRAAGAAGASGAT